MGETEQKPTDTTGYIDVTGVPLEALVRAAYAPSRQQGLGYFNPEGRKGDLSDDKVAEIVGRNKCNFNAVSMDYVNGRSVKFNVYRMNGGHYIRSDWYDHSDQELRDLLESVGISGDAISEARQAKERPGQGSHADLRGRCHDMAYQGSTPGAPPVSIRNSIVRLADRIGWLHTVDREVVAAYLDSSEQTPNEAEKIPDWSARCFGIGVGLVAAGLLLALFYRWGLLVAAGGGIFAAIGMRRAEKAIGKR